MEPDQVARFEQLFAAHYGGPVRFATRRVGADAAGDVVASTFLIAWRRLAAVPTGQSRAWLYGTARRVIANELRGRERRERLGRRVGTHADTVADDHAGPVTERLRVRTGDTLLIPYEFTTPEQVRPGGVDAALYGSVLVRDVPDCFPGRGDVVYTPDRVGVR